MCGTACVRILSRTSLCTGQCLVTTRPPCRTPPTCQPHRKARMLQRTKFCTQQPSKMPHEQQGGVGTYTTSTIRTPLHLRQSLCSPKIADFQPGYLCLSAVHLSVPGVLLQPQPQPFQSHLLASTPAPTPACACTPAAAAATYRCCCCCRWRWCCVTFRCVTDRAAQPLLPITTEGTGQARPRTRTAAAAPAAAWGPLHVSVFAAVNRNAGPSSLTQPA